MGKGFYLEDISDPWNKAEYFAGRAMAVTRQTPALIESKITRAPLHSLEFSLSRHAQRQLDARRLGAAAVTAVLWFGREVHTRGATVRAIGRKEVARWRHEGIDLRLFEGVQIICASDGTVITGYRNHDFRGLRPRLGRRRQGGSPALRVSGFETGIYG